MNSYSKERGNNERAMYNIDAGRKAEFVGTGEG